LRLSRSLAFGIGLAALILAAGLETSAFAARAKLSGEAMPAGFGRLSLTFDAPTQTRIRVANGVLVVAFGDEVQLDTARIARELPAYVSVARLDPDGRGMRLALTQAYKANLIEAGDKAFIDLLPQNWTGLMPGPPPEAIAELTERLRLAEARARDAARQPAAPPAPLTMRSASLPTLERLIFKAPADTKLTSELADGALKLTFDRPLTIEAPAVRSALPDGIELATLDAGKEALSLTLSLPADWQARSFSDETGLIVDLLRPIKEQAPSLSDLGKPAATPAPAAAAPAPAAEPAPSLQPAATPAPAVAAPAAQPEPPPGPVTMTAEGKRLDFRFPRPTGAAAFLDAGVMTLVFDTRDTIDPARLSGLLPGLIEESTVTREGKVTLVRLRLAGQPLARLFDDGTAWSLDLGEEAGRAAAPVEPRRGMDERGQTIVAVPLAGLTGVHWLESGPAGLPVAVATATGPTRLTPKSYRFVEFGLLRTAQGLAVQPRADDVVVHAGTEEVRIGRSSGLNVSLDIGAPGRKAEEKADKQEAAPLLDPDVWGKLRAGNLRERAYALLLDATDASRGRKSQARLALARFYAANGLMPEAAGVLNTLLAEDAAMRANHEALFLKGVVAAGLHRDQQALAAFEAAPIREQAEAGLWRALMEQRLNRNAQALVGFRRAETVLERYPADLQGEFREAMARAALAQQDMSVAERQVQALGELPRGGFDQERLALLQALLDDASGRPEAAMNGYRPLFEAKSRPVAAEAQLRAVKLADAEARADLKSDEAIARLETVAVIWRGGRLEIEALAELGRLYADRQRWRDAFLVARRANENFPDDPLTRRMHDETAQRFAELFGGAGLADLPRIEALALFYDFKEFLPIGRRGDEITRLLADRLVELDLLDQAAEILRYQMDRRLTGAARSTVAARLAMIELMNGKPADAVRALNTTRLVELPADVKRARLLLEAKALSDLSRTDQALEMLESERGPEIDRLRADIYWTGRRWREAGEAYERLLGESWRGESALGDGERADVMRAGVSYVMAGEALSLDRLRSKFAPKMAGGPDARTFAFVTGADRSRASDIREMARATANADTLSEFLKAYRERYPAYSAAMRKPRPPAADKLPSPAEGAEAGPAAPSRS
jgi:tetratricopeptide (TPR) repeat protein